MKFVFPHEEILYFINKFSSIFFLGMCDHIEKKYLKIYLYNIKYVFLSET